uniref:Uncharacterized protein n=1 Tax=Pipistrellus kuhlii TaxID=59472 RepID=A0A7J8A7G4_PIPKU|nr:hypothetical protein mPipKuh1_008823 [Pipistrellus kuhlii]
MLISISSPGLSSKLEKILFYLHWYFQLCSSVHLSKSTCPRIIHHCLSPKLLVLLHFLSVYISPLHTQDNNVIIIINFIYSPNIKSFLNSAQHTSQSFCKSVDFCSTLELPSWFIILYRFLQ